MKLREGGVGGRELDEMQGIIGEGGENSRLKLREERRRREDQHHFTWSLPHPVRVCLSFGIDELILHSTVLVDLTTKMSYVKRENNN